MVIENLRAKVLLEVIVRPDLVKVQTQLHRRSIEAMETIQRLNSPHAIEMVSVVSPVKELALEQSKEKA